MKTDIDLSEDRKPGDDLESAGTCSPRRHNEELRDDSTNSRKMNIFILCLIGSLVLFGILVYINQQTGFLTTSNLAYYKYSNGDEEFNVRKVIRDNYVGWQIELYVEDYRYLLELYNGPATLEDISINRSVKSMLLDDKNIFVTWEPEQNRTIKTAFAFDDINKAVDNPDLLDIPVNLSQMSAYNNFSIKTCKDAKKYSSVIWLKLGTETAIKADGNCVILEGKTEDELLMAADRLVYLLLGVMN